MPSDEKPAQGDLQDRVSEPRESLGPAQKKLAKSIIAGLPRTDVENLLISAMAKSFLAGLPRADVDALLLHALLSNRITLGEIIEGKVPPPRRQQESANSVESSQKAHKRKGKAKQRPTSPEGNPPSEMVVTNADPEVVRRGDALSGVPVTQSQVPVPQSASAQKTADSPPKTKRRRESSNGFEPSKHLRHESLPPHDILTEPLSRLTESWKKPRLCDIKAYIDRPIEDRYWEIQNEVRQPANPFALYTKAYRARARKYFFMNNPEVEKREVDRHSLECEICEESWNVEDVEVKKKFEMLYEVENAQHEKALARLKKKDRRR